MRPSCRLTRHLSCLTDESSVSREPAVPIDPTAPLSPSVLVVDDEPLLRWALRETLRTRYPVYDAGTVREASQLIDALGVDLRLLLLDLRLPDGLGLDLVARARAANPACHVVMLTAYADSTQSDIAKAQGVEAILKKPIQMEELLRYATSVLG